MSFWRRLFGGGPQTASATPIPAQKNAVTATLGEQLIDAAKDGRKKPASSYDGVVDGLGCVFYYPPTWVRGRQGDYTILQPDFARRIMDNNVPYVTPCMTYYQIQSDSLADNALLDYWADSRKSTQGYVLHEMSKFTIGDFLAVALHYDYTRASGIWSALAVLRVKGGTGYFFDVSGLKEDITGRQSIFIPVLAHLNIS